MNTNKRPWLLRPLFFVSGSLLLAGVFVLLAYLFYEKANQPAKFTTKLGEQALQISVVVLAGAAIKEFVDWRTAAKAEQARKEDLRKEFLRRLREVHVKAAHSRDLMRAHRSAKSWAEQSRNLMQMIAEVEETSEDLKASPNLFHDQDDIIIGIENLIAYLGRCREEYIVNHAPVDADWKEKRSLDDTIRERDMVWTQDFLEGTGSFKSEYAANLGRAKGPMRQAVFGAEAANKTPHAIPAEVEKLTSS